jgi:hypothetical protein
MAPHRRDKSLPMWKNYNLGKRADLATKPEKKICYNDRWGGAGQISTACRDQPPWQ